MYFFKTNDTVFEQVTSRKRVLTVTDNTDGVKCEQRQCSEQQMIYKSIDFIFLYKLGQSELGRTDEVRFRTDMLLVLNIH